MAGLLLNNCQNYFSIGSSIHFRSFFSSLSCFFFFSFLDVCVFTVNRASLYNVVLEDGISPAYFSYLRYI